MPYFGVAVICATKGIALVYVASPIALVGIAVAAIWRALIVVLIAMTVAVWWWLSSPPVLSNITIVLISVVAIARTTIVELVITVSIAALLSTVTHLIICSFVAHLCLFLTRARGREEDTKINRTEELSILAEAHLLIYIDLEMLDLSHSRLPCGWFLMTKWKEFSCFWIVKVFTGTEFSIAGTKREK